MSKLVLIHSSGLGPSQWQRYQKDFDQWHPVAPYLLGYEENTVSTNWKSFTIEDDVCAIEETLVDEEELVLLGHSYGGMVALQLALKNPERIQGMVLFEPVAYGLLRETIEDKEAMENTIKTFLEKGHEDPEGWIETFLDYWNGDGAYQKMGDEERSPFLQHAAKIFAEVRQLMCDETPATSYEALDMPTLILCSEKTIMEMRYICGKLSQHMPQAEFVELEEAGHMAPLTHYGQVAHHLFQFFDRL